jgi:hypothetical protein
MWQIVHLVIRKFKIQLYLNFKIVKIDDTAYKEIINLSVYESIREKLFENNMLIIVLIE